MQEHWSKGVSLFNTYLPSWVFNLISVNIEVPLLHYWDTSVHISQLMNTMSGQSVVFRFTVMSWQRVLFQALVHLHVLAQKELQWCVLGFHRGNILVTNKTIVYSLHRHLCNWCHHRPCCFRAVGSQGEPSHYLHFSTAQWQRVAINLARFPPLLRYCRVYPALLLPNRVCSCSW